MSNFNSHSSSEAGAVIFVYKAENNCCQEVNGAIYFASSLKADSQECDLEFTLSNPTLKAVSSNASLGSTVHFWGNDWGFLKEGVKTYSIAPIDSPRFFHYYYYFFFLHGYAVPIIVIDGH
jgi:hypothetical protein